MFCRELKKYDRLRGGRRVEDIIVEQKVSRFTMFSDNKHSPKICVFILT